VHNLLVENSLEIISIAALPPSDFHRILKICTKTRARKPFNQSVDHSISIRRQNYL